MHSSSLFSFSSSFGQNAKAGGNTSKGTCYPFVNDSKKICVGNRWVTLFPPCCLPGINIHPCCCKAYYPLALFILVKWLCWNVNLPQEENTGSEEFTCSGTLVRSFHLMLARAAMKSQDIYLMWVITINNRFCKVIISVIFTQKQDIEKYQYGIALINCLNASDSNMEINNTRLLSIHTE